MESLIKIFLDKGKLVLVISSLLMLCSCISINDSNIEVSSEEYVAEIKGLLGRSEFVSAAQQIYAAEIMDNPVITRTEILELWQETISTLKNGIDRKNEEGDYLKSFNKLDLQKLFSGTRVKKMVIRHKSAYNEMIGLQDCKEDNTLEVMIGGEEYANP